MCNLERALHSLKLLNNAKSRAPFRAPGKALGGWTGGAHAGYDEQTPTA